MSRSVVTRFAPSPTGVLHIGGARTALFNWLFARKHNGVFLLRIEDTDRQRSTPEATAAILDALDWLGLKHDGETVIQSANTARHVAVAHHLLVEGRAYKCFATTQEIEAFRKAAKDGGKSTPFRSPWRDTDSAGHPDGPYVIRIKAPREGETTIRDRIQGEIRIGNDQLDDMVILRTDGTPVYMLAVVVDDHDMGVTHVIRGDDHLNNAARQMMVYDAMGWRTPVWAHIPLIHGSDGKKLSKRHGALAAGEYRLMGYPASGMRNYLARLGWSHGNTEVFTDMQLMQWFDLGGIGRNPARFDVKKLASICGKHMAMLPDRDLLEELENYIAAAKKTSLTSAQRKMLEHALPSLKIRAKTFPDLLDKAHFVLSERPVSRDGKADAILGQDACRLLNDLTRHLWNANWTHDGLEAALNSFAEARGVGFGEVAAPLRAALAGRTVTPSVLDMLVVLKREESLARMRDAAG